MAASRFEAGSAFLPKCGALSELRVSFGQDHGLQFAHLCWFCVSCALKIQSVPCFQRDGKFISRCLHHNSGVFRSLLGILQVSRPPTPIFGETILVRP